MLGRRVEVLSCGRSEIWADSRQKSVFAAPGYLDTLSIYGTLQISPAGLFGEEEERWQIDSKWFDNGRNYSEEAHCRGEGDRLSARRQCQGETSIFIAAANLLILLCLAAGQSTPTLFPPPIIGTASFIISHYSFFIHRRRRASEMQQKWTRRHQRGAEDERENLHPPIHPSIYPPSFPGYRDQI